MASVLLYVKEYLHLWDFVKENKELNTQKVNANRVKVHSLLKQWFARTLLDTIWRYALSADFQANIS